jgi:aspartate racemase
VKTIGVIGGLGPQATIDFESRVHRVAQRLVPPAGPSGYPPLVVYYYRSVPFVATESGVPELPLRPHPDLIEAAAKLGGIADFIVITSNFLHLFAADVERASGCEVLSMIDVTLAEVDRRRWRHVGVLGFGDPLVYTQRLGPMGLTSETITDELRTGLDRAILMVMEGRDDAHSARTAHDAVEELQARGVDGIILGCTEIPLLLGDAANTPDLINPLQLLAEAAVNHALN